MGEGEPDLIGRTVDGRYEVIEQLGEGGMGAVYRARHTGLDKAVALKLLHADFAQEPVVLERFRREAKAASAIGHPGIVPVTDFGEIPEGPYLVMELVEGGSLRDRLQEGGRLEVRRALALTAQIAEALAAAHDAGVVHRDLKPANVLVGEDGAARVADFGIAKVVKDDGSAALTRTGDVVGTPQYMSPEQCAGKDLDGRTDVYALGLLLFELLSGRPPFVAPSLIQLVNLHVLEAPPSVASFRPEVAPEVAALVEEMLAKDPADRPQTMREVARRARELADAETDRLASQPTMSGEDVDPSLAPTITPRSSHGPLIGAAPEPTAERVSMPAPTVPTPPRPWALYAIGALVAGSLTAVAVAMAVRTPSPATVEQPPPPLTVHSEPSAELRVDGVSLGRTPIELDRRQLPLEAVLVAPGYDDLALTVPRDAPVRVDVSLVAVAEEPASPPAGLDPEPPVVEEPEPPERVAEPVRRGGRRRGRREPPEEPPAEPPGDRPSHPDIEDPF